MEKYCNGCSYYDDLGYCEYILKTGKRRPCAFGEGCTEHTNPHLYEKKVERVKINYLQVKKLFLEGKTDKQIAEIIGNTAKAVTSWRHRNGLKHYTIYK